MISSICLLVAFLGFSIFNGTGTSFQPKEVLSNAKADQPTEQCSVQKPPFDEIKHAIETIKSKHDGIHIIHQKITLNEYDQPLCVNKRIYWKKYRRKPTTQAHTFRRSADEAVKKFEFIYRDSHKSSFLAIYKDKHNHITKKERVYFA